ncbi:MAG: FHA domain-containing protein [Myxococcota bacterium]
MTTSRLGIVCGNCGALNPLDVPACQRCGQELGFEAPPLASHIDEAAAETTTPVDAQLTREELMEQARNYVCRSCGSAVQMGHKFCGACGAGVPDAIQDAREEYFGTMQAPGTARLTVIRGQEGTEGLNYMLQGQEHVAGRGEGVILFPEDAWLSPRHANFIYQGEKLVVRDEGSTNGVYLRVRGEAPLQAGSLFLCGEQVFRVEGAPADTAGPDPDQTYFYSSPKKPTTCMITQLIEGGYEGMVHCAKEGVVRIGREDADMNFPEDIYMSGSHAEVRAEGGGFKLVDLDSRNGTYVRIQGEHELQHGDYLFLGHQLLRVEMTV